MVATSRKLWTPTWVPSPLAPCNDYKGAENAASEAQTHTHTHIINWRICNVAGVLYVSGDMLTWQSCQKIIIPASTPLFVLLLQLQLQRLRRRQRASICQRLKGQHISLPLPFFLLPSHIFLSQFAAAQKNLKVAKKLANKLAANGFNKWIIYALTHTRTHMHSPTYVWFAFNSLFLILKNCIFIF